MKYILNNSKNVLLAVSSSHNMVDKTNTFLINTLLPMLQQLYKNQDIAVAAKIHDKISQSMLSNDPSSVEYNVEIKEALENVHKFS